MTKKLFLALIAVLFIKTHSVLYAQEEERQDTIIKVEGKVMPVDVTTVTTSYVKFIVKGSDEIYTLPRKEIHKIIYKNGRIEEYNQLVLISIDENAWQAVWLTKDIRDVEGLYKRGVIKAQAPPSYRSPKAAKKNCTIRIQKKTAALGGQVFLITDNKATGGYGDPSGYFYEGVVYGTEPLEEEVSGDDIL